jgi:phospholipid-transporting ATPase
MNSTAAPSKRSQIEYIVDRVIFFMFFLLFAFCITGAVYDSYWIKDDYPKHWYLGTPYYNKQYDPEKWRQSGGYNFITCFILYGEQHDSRSGGCGCSWWWKLSRAGGRIGFRV